VGQAGFSSCQRDVIDRGIFTSVADLKRKILRYIGSIKRRQTISLEILRSNERFLRTSDVSGTAH